MSAPTQDPSRLRTEYKRATLDEGSAHPDPFAQFARWFDETVAAGVPEPNAMALATVSADGRPAARIVLLKGADERGFTFFTNYDSRKGRELAAAPQAALLFHWIELERQVRIEGVVERVPAIESDRYFESRPHRSRVGALASPQSEPIADRAWLEQRFAEAETRYPAAVPRPAHWGGFRLCPDRFEFWQGRPNRLHDRLAYRSGATGWTLQRLAP